MLCLLGNLSLPCRHTLSLQVRDLGHVGRPLENAIMKPWPVVCMTANAISKLRLLSRSRISIAQPTRVSMEALRHAGQALVISCSNSIQFAFGYCVLMGSPYGEISPPRVPSHPPCLSVKSLPMYPLNATCPSFLAVSPYIFPLGTSGYAEKKPRFLNRLKGLLELLFVFCIKIRVHANYCTLRGLTPREV